MDRFSLQPTGSALLHKLVHVNAQEVAALLWSFLYFFCLLCAYYILRPLREEMAIAGGVENLQWVFTGTFIVMLAAVPLFGMAASRLPRSKLLPIVYLFFIANIMIFFALFQYDAVKVYTARAFFIWTSVFNLFVVSVFWSFMTDIFSNNQGKRLFGFIAAGGSMGAITGPLITAQLAEPLGPTNLLPISALLLAIAMLCIRALSRWSVHHGERRETTRISHKPIGGSIWAGIKQVLESPFLMGICLFIWLYTTLATFLYFSQAHIIAETFDDPAQRTTLFAWIDLAVNSLTVITQLALTGRLMKWLGLPMILALVPVLTAAGFMGLGLAPVLPMLLSVQVMRRAGNFALTRPAREILFTVVNREARYKAKNFIDTVVYRGGDVISGWVFVGLKSLGLGLSSIALLAVPLALLWAFVGWSLGNKQERLKTDAEP